MQVPVNKDLESYRDDFFKGLTWKQTAVSVVSVAAGTGVFLLGNYVLHLDQSVSFYLALPVVLPIAASGFLQVHGMSPYHYLQKRRRVRKLSGYTFIPYPLLREEGSLDVPGARTEILVSLDPEKPDLFMDTDGEEA